MSEETLSGRRRPNRKRVTVRFDSDDDPLLAVADPDVAERVSLHDRLQRATASLTPKRRKAWELRMEGCNYQEIASCLDTTPGAARVAVHRARKDLRHLLADLAPVIIFIVVLALLLATVGVTSHLQPVRPIPILPRSHSDEGLYVAPLDPDDCRRPARTADSLVRRVRAPSASLRLAVDPLLKAGTASGQYVATVVLTNTAKTAESTVFTLDNMAITFYTNDHKFVIIHVPVDRGRLPSTIRLGPGQERRFVVPFTIIPCTHPKSHSLIGLNATHYLAKTTVEWTEGNSRFDWISPVVPVRIRTSSQPLPRAHTRSVQCTLLSRAGNEYYFDLFAGLRRDFDVAIYSGSRSVTSNGDLTLSLLITNISRSNRALDISVASGIAESSTTSSNATPVLAPGQTVATSVLLSPKQCGSIASFSPGNYIIERREPPLPLTNETDSAVSIMPWPGGGACSYCEWFSYTNYSAGARVVTLSSSSG